MHIKEVEKVVKKLSKIKELDEQIIKLEKLAMQAANDAVQTKIKLFITEPVLPEISPECVIEKPETSYESLFSNLQFRWSIALGEKEANKKSNTNDFTEEVSDTTAMQIFGLLIRDKQIKRDSIIKSLAKHGVTI